MIRKCRLLVNTKVISNIINLQQNRTATVLRRVHKPPLLTKGECASGKISQNDLDINGIPKFFDGSSEELRPDPWYLRYEVIEEDADAELPPVKLILMKSMEDFGKRGQVTIERSVSQSSYMKLLVSFGVHLYYMTIDIFRL